MTTKDKSSAAGGSFGVRPVEAADLDRITAIDTGHMGASRRGYFEKRLDGGQRYADEAISLALASDQGLAGFALVRLEDGEFGRPGSVAVLDAIGVDKAAQGRGGGRALMGAVIKALGKKGVSELVTQVDWSQRALLEFLGAAGFGLDGRVVLSRPAAELPPSKSPTPSPKARPRSTTARPSPTIPPRWRATASRCVRSPRPIWPVSRPSTGGIRVATAPPTMRASSTRC
ncbi:MAG: GNAT family N-acetyltransferase [Roseovarius sp.]|nr:GNAT family N-acetyltransferase [Roseovarius sp.]